MKYDSRDNLMRIIQAEEDYPNDEAIQILCRMFRPGAEKKAVDRDSYKGVNK